MLSITINPTIKNAIPYLEETKKALSFFVKFSLSTFSLGLLLAGLIIFTTLSFIPIITNQYFASVVFDKDKLLSHNDDGVVLLDRNDKPFFTFYTAKAKEDVSLSEIPKYTQEALIATEDRRFYSHHGLSYRSIARAFLTNLLHKDISNGGSTITQQLVKNTLLTPEKSFLRKYQEMILALDLDHKYPKDEILEMYFNSVYFGEGARGIQNAAKTYFNKDAKDLTLPESAMLVALLPAPSYYSPISNDPSRVEARKELVLQKMREEGYITPAQEDQAKKEKIVLKPQDTEMNKYGIHFALMVKDQLEKEFGEENLINSGYRIKTTLDLDWQKEAEKVVSKQVNNLKGQNVSNGAAVVIDPKTGEIKALVGSTNWFDENFGKLNLATSTRSAGSAFKPLIYLSAFEKKLITPATILQDVPTSFANFDESKFFAQFPTRQAALANLAQDPNAFYKPQNYDRRFRGPVTVRRALSNSLNVPAVAVMKKVGVEDGLNMAKRLGITTLKEPQDYGLSLVLGTGEVSLLELTNAYAAFANNGVKNEPTSILEIKDRSGQVVYQNQPKSEQVADPKDVFLLTSILSDNKARSEVFGNALTISRPAAVKTGTGEDYKNALTLGYTPSLAIGVWVGNNNSKPMSQVAGSLGAAPIWKDLMEKFLAGTPVENFDPPSGIITLQTCGREASSSATEYFEEGTQPVNKKCLPSPTTQPRPQPKIQIIQPDKPKKDDKPKIDQPDQNQKDTIIYIENTQPQDLVFLPN